MKKLYYILPIFLVLATQYAMAIIPNIPSTGNYGSNAVSSRQTESDTESSLDSFSFESSTNSNIEKREIERKAPTKKLILAQKIGNRVRNFKYRTLQRKQSKRT